MTDKLTILYASIFIFSLSTVRAVRIKFSIVKDERRMKIAIFLM